MKKKKVKPAKYGLDSMKYADGGPVQTPPPPPQTDDLKAGAKAIKSQKQILDERERAAGV